MKREIPKRWRAVAVLAAAGAGAALAFERDDLMDTLWRMHDAYVLAFVESEGFGQTRLPAMSGLLHRPVDGTPWFVAHLELIGVAKHNPPRAFGDGMSMDVFHQPNKEAPLTRGPGRPIAADEAQALRALDAGQRLVARRSGPAGLRVFGAIRAGDECLGCHKNKRAGDMLGAFVYHLEPMPKAQPQTVPAPSSDTASKR